MPRTSMFGSARQRATASGRSPGMIPSRRSPSSTMSITPCTRSARAAAAESSSTISTSVAQLMSAAATTRSTSLGERRSDQDRSARRCRRREAVRCSRPANRRARRRRPRAARDRARAVPRIALVIARDGDAPRPRLGGRAPAAFSPMRSRSISIRGELTERRRPAPGGGSGTHGTPCRASASVGRASASVAGMPSTASYPAIATEISASVMPSWLIVIPITLVCANVSMRLISLTTVGIGTFGKSLTVIRAGACCRITPAGRLPRRIAVELR